MIFYVLMIILIVAALIDVVELIRNKGEANRPSRRARALLREHLSPVQRATYQAAGWFDVYPEGSPNRYRITNRDTYNIWVFANHGYPEARLCFYPEGRLPVGDVLVSQKLALETREDEVLNLANWDYYPERVQDFPGPTLAARQTAGNPARVKGDWNWNEAAESWTPITAATASSSVTWVTVTTVSGSGNG